MFRIQLLHVKNMPCFKEINFDIIDDTVFVLLYDLYKSKNPDIPYWHYEKFDLEKLNDDQCKVTFRFSKNHIYDLKETLNTPEEIMCYTAMYELIVSRVYVQF